MTARTKYVSRWSRVGIAARRASVRRVSVTPLTCVEASISIELSKTVAWASSPEKEIKASVDEFKQSSGITACSS